MNRIFCLLIQLACCFILTLKCHAEVLRWPQLCVSGKLQIRNNSSSSAPAWLQKFTPSLTEENEITLAPAATTELMIKVTETNTWFSLLSFKKAGVVQATFHCDTLTYPTSSLEGGVLTFKKSDAFKNTLYLKNLFFDNNLIHVEYLDWQHKFVSEAKVSLGPFQKLNYETPNLKSTWSFVRVWADHRFLAFNMNLTGAALPDQIQPQSTNLPEKATYFVVGDRTNLSDTFLIQLSDPIMIAKAREQISHPNLEKIVFARLQKGHGQFNRNWSKKEKSFWSWSAAEVTNISDLGSTSCNGLPQAVEDRAELWLKDPGQICFWRYRIKKELTATEVISGIQTP